MTDEELIQLLDDHMPADLSAAQIEQLRERMRESEAVRDALVAEIRLEENLAAHHAPPSADFERLLEQVDAITQADELRSRPVKAWPFIAAVLAVIGVGALVVYLLPEPKDDATEVVVDAPGPNPTPTPPDAPEDDPENGSPDGATGEGGDGETDQGEGQPGDAEQPDGDEPETELVVEALPPHRFFDHNWRGNADRWQQRVRRILAGRKFDDRGSSIDVDGAYRLKPALTEGRLLRLAMDDLKRLVITGWVGREGVRFRYDDGEWWAEAVKAKDDQRRKVEKVESLGRGHGLWRARRYGPVDLRYQSGRLVLATGRRVIVWGPLASAPESVELNMRGDLRLADWRAAEPIGMAEDGEAAVGAALAALNENVDASVDWDASWDAEEWTEVRDAAAAVKPAEIAVATWDRAVAWQTTQHSDHGDARRAAAAFIVERAIAAGSPTSAVLDALAALPEGYRIDGRGDLSWRWMMGRFDELARRELHAGRPGQLGKIYDAWFALPMGEGGDDFPHDEHVVPPTLARLHLYQLADSGDETALRLAAKRLLFAATWGSGELRFDRDDEQVARLARWAARTASQRIGDRPAGEIDPLPIEWSHPLQVESDRAALNTFAEFLAAVEVGAFEQAVTLLTQRELPDGIAPVARGERLFQSIHLRVQQILRAEPALVRQLRERYAEIGELRLQKARAERDVRAMEAIAVQFYGTPAGREALATLADRDLAMGNFFIAAARYRDLMERYGGVVGADVAAKLRLASAMTGQRVGEPVTEPVMLAGGSVEAGAFESMVDQALARQASAAESNGSAVGRASAPSAEAMKKPRVRELGVIEMAKEDRVDQPGRYSGWAFAEDRVVVNHRGRVEAFDLKNRKRVWAVERDFDDDRRVRHRMMPAVAGGTVVARMPVGRDDRVVALRLSDGEMVWEREFDRGLVTDPVVVGSWVYVFSWRHGSGDTIDIVLRRVALQSGQSAQETRLVSLRDDEANRAAPTPMVGDSSLVLAVGNTLLCCDLLGELRWVRRMSFIPDDADESLWQSDRRRKSVLAGDRIITAMPGSSHVSCVDLATGQLVWQVLRPELRDVIGVTGERVLIGDEGEMQALDLGTGQMRWSRPLETPVDMVAAAAGGQTLSVRMPEREEDEDKSMGALTWYDPAGEAVATREMDFGERDAGEVVFSDGRRVLIICDVNARDGKARLVMVE